MAGGVAVGLFAGLVPGSNPVQFIVAALLAIALHVNLPIALVVTLYSNPLTVVPLYYIAYKLGLLVLSCVGKPLMIGLPLLAVILAVVGYFVVDYAWQWHVRYEWSRRRRRRAARDNAKA